MPDIQTKPHPIEGVPTTTAGFAGLASVGLAAIMIDSFSAFCAAAGTAASRNLTLAVRGFFENGGQLRAVTSQVSTRTATTQKGFGRLLRGVPLLGVNGLSQQLTDAENQELAARGINALRFFPGRGNLVWGARTTAVQSMDWKYVNVRRLLIFIEQSIQDGTQWAVFEPNGPSLWAQLRQSVNNFLQTLWRAGGLTGSKPSDAFLVHCDQSTMTQADIDNGRLIMDISVAPVKPAEFVIFRIGMQVQCPTC